MDAGFEEFIHRRGLDQGENRIDEKTAHEFRQREVLRVLRARQGWF